MKIKNILLVAVSSLIGLGSIAFLTKNKWSIAKPLEEENKIPISSLANNKEVLVEESNDKKKQGFFISFYINDQVFRINMLENGFSEPELISNGLNLEQINMEKYFTTSLMPKAIFESLPISKNMMFYSGLQSNLDPNFWIYTERVDQGVDFKVRTYNTLTKESKVLFSNDNSPNIKHAFKPIAISNDNSKVYLEALEFGSHLNNIEIWELNLNSLISKKLNIHPNYNITPKMSPDGKYLLYSSGAVPNDVHSPSNHLNVYDLVNSKETQVYANNDSYVGVKGWVKSE
jgi:hypothetical protein